MRWHAFYLTLLAAVITVAAFLWPRSGPVGDTGIEALEEELQNVRQEIQVLRVELQSVARHHPPPVTPQPVLSEKVVGVEERPAPDDPTEAPASRRNSTMHPVSADEMALTLTGVPLAAGVMDPLTPWLNLADTAATMSTGSGAYAGDWLLLEHRLGGFDAQVAALTEIQHPQERLHKIRNLAAAHVMHDTLGVIDWALGLEDPEEQRVAMEAINKHAVVGIGAQVSMDNDSGLPVLNRLLDGGAAAGTGVIRPKDRVEAVVQEDGSVVELRNKPLPEIIDLLRGSPGTSLRLRVNNAEGNDPRTVPLVRQMIVMQP